MSGRRTRDLSFTLAILVTVIIAGFLIWLVVRSPAEPTALVVSQSADSTPEFSVPDDTDEPVVSDPEPTTAPTTTVPATTTTLETLPPFEPVETTTTLPPDTDATVDSSVDLVETTAVPTTVEIPTTPPTVLAGPTYPTLPDGSPVPVLGVFDGPTITISGNVRSEAAREQLIALAIANSKDPSPTVDDQLTIDPNVPASIGVRVIEMDSVRFPDASAEILPDHAAELDRVVAIMEIFPDVTVLVIGHSDQRGSEEQNFIISTERAEAVRDYLVSKGVSPVRINSRAVGEADLLTEGRDRASLALNRRTEFVFYGLLADY